MQNYWSFALLFLVASGSVALVPATQEREERIPMTNKLMGELLEKEFGKERVKGQSGAWQIALLSLIHI